MQPGSPFLRAFYALGGVAYLLMALLLGFFAIMTPMTCASGNCVAGFITAMFVWTLVAAAYALFIAVMAFVKARTNPRWLTLSLMSFPFIFWSVYWLLVKAAGVA